MGDGTLARTSILGSAPRMVEHVREADWNPDGSDLAVVRQMAGYDNPMRAKPTSQQRSQDERDRILTAMDALLLRTSFAEISVADLVAKAKVVQATIDAARTSAGTPTRNAMPCIFPEKDMSRRGVPTGSIGNLAAIATPTLAARRRIWPTRSRLDDARGASATNRSALAAAHAAKQSAITHA